MTDLAENSHHPSHHIDSCCTTLWNKTVPDSPEKTASSLDSHSSDSSDVLGALTDTESIQQEKKNHRYDLKLRKQPNLKRVSKPQPWSEKLLHVVGSS